MSLTPQQIAEQVRQTQEARARRLMELRISGPVIQREILSLELSRSGIDQRRQEELSRYSGDTTSPAGRSDIANIQHRYVLEDEQLRRQIQDNIRSLTDVEREMLDLENVDTPGLPRQKFEEARRLEQEIFGRHNTPEWGQHNTEFWNNPAQAESYRSDLRRQLADTRQRFNEGRHLEARLGVHNTPEWGQHNRAYWSNIEPQSENNVESYLSDLRRQAAEREPADRQRNEAARAIYHQTHGGSLIPQYNPANPATWITPERFQNLSSEHAAWQQENARQQSQIAQVPRQQERRPQTGFPEQPYAGMNPDLVEQMRQYDNYIIPEVPIDQYSQPAAEIPNLAAQPEEYRAQAPDPFLAQTIPQASNNASVSESGGTLPHERYLEDVRRRAREFSTKPYEAGLPTSNRVAPENSRLMQARGLTADYSPGSGRDFERDLFNQSRAAMLTTMGQRFPQYRDQYLNPYRHEVADRIAQLGNRNFQEKILPMLSAEFIKAGQHGSGRHAKMARNAARDMQREISADQASMMHKGYGEAMQGFNWDQARQAQLSDMMGKLGLGAGASRMANIEALMKMGNAERDSEQFRRDLAQEERMRAKQHEMEQLGFLSNIINGQPFVANTFNKHTNQTTPESMHTKDWTNFGIRQAPAFARFLSNPRNS